MSRLPASPSNDAAVELAMAAMARERANRPRHYLLLGALLFAIALGYLLWVVSTRGAAAARFRSARNDFANLESLVAQVRSNYDAASEKLYAPDPKLVNKLETIAESMGLQGIQPASSGTCAWPPLAKTFATLAVRR